VGERVPGGRVRGLPLATLSHPMGEGLGVRVRSSFLPVALIS